MSSESYGSLEWIMSVPASVDVGWPCTPYHMLGRQKLGVHLRQGPRGLARRSVQIFRQEVPQSTVS